MSSFNSPKIVALLPMKAHSSRVPGKNFRNLCGKPLFRWILDSLHQIDKISQIVINTDARNILDEHKIYNFDKVLIRDRKPEICGDDISMNLVLQDDISNIESDIFLMTHTTNPLISPETILNSINLFQQALATRDADSLFSVSRVASAS